MSTTAVESLRKSIEVAVPLERAWEAFTAEVGAWWPTNTHALSPGQVAEIVIEARVGGDWYELTTTGERNLVATVLEWQPPHLLRVAWKAGEPTTEIEVRFSPSGSGTRVDLEHSGWSEDDERRGNYDEGWNFVLGRFADHLG